MFRYEADRTGDLSFKIGETIWVLQEHTSGWWVGRTDKGERGIFPFNRIKPAKDQMFCRLIIPSNIKNAIGDIVENIKIIPEEPIPQYNHYYMIKIHLSNGKRVTGKKQIKDFRQLASAIHMLTGFTEEIEGTLFPEKKLFTLPHWADNIRLRKSVAAERMKERASILASFVQKRLEDSHNCHFLLVHWLDRKFPFDISPLVKTDVRGILEKVRKMESSLKFQPPSLVIFEHDWNKTDEKEISALKGEIIAFNENSRFEGWWTGENANGIRGIFPSNYIRKLVTAEVDKALFPSGMVSPRNNRVAVQPEEIDPNKGKRKNATEFKRPGPVRPEGGARQRQKISRYNLCSRDAFDELVKQGLTMEEDDRLAKVHDTRRPGKGDTVTLFYSAYLWYPEQQDLLEFASSDQLVSDNKPGPLVFVIGENQAIDGIEEAVKRMSLGQAVRVVLHPKKAYQEYGYPPDVPGNSYLVYDLMLSDITEASSFTHTSRVLNTVSIRPRELTVREVLASVDTAKNLEKKLTIEQLRKIVQTKSFKRYNVDIARTEDYLTEKEFFYAFKVERTVWTDMPTSDKVQMKRKLGLL